MILGGILVLVTAGLTYYAKEKETKERIKEYKEAFSKGYETKHGSVPFVTETPVNEIHSSYEEEMEEEERPNYFVRERGDD